MSAFKRACTVEAMSWDILRPLFDKLPGSYELITDRVSQSAVGDLIFTDERGRNWSVELKAEQRSTGSLFLESWSNRNLESAEDHWRRGSTPGWLVKLSSQLLLYHMLDRQQLFAVNLFALQRWAFTAPRNQMSEPDGRGKRRPLLGRIHDFGETSQQQFDQPNDTWGWLVPLDVLDWEVNPTPKLFHVPKMRLTSFSQLVE